MVLSELLNCVISRISTYAVSIAMALLVKCLVSLPAVRLNPSRLSEFPNRFWDKSLSLLQTTVFETSRFTCRNRETSLRVREELGAILVSG